MVRSFLCVFLLSLATFRLSLNAEERVAKPAAVQVPGPQEGGVLLPNGWRITPVGEQLNLPDLPLNIVISPDGKYALTATSGYNQHQLSVFELATRKRVDSLEVRESWFGLALGQSTAGGPVRGWWSGGGAGTLHTVTLTDLGKLENFKPEPQAEAGGVPTPFGFKTGLCFDRQHAMLYSLTIYAKGDNKSLAWGEHQPDKTSGGALTAIDLTGKKPVTTQPLGLRPYDIVQAEDGRLYVSDWAAKQVLVVDSQTLKVVKEIPVGAHPNQLVLHPKDGRLFVACASSDAVSVIQTATGLVEETISTALFPKAPAGATPDALALTPDGETLFVANADNNCVAVIDVEEPRHSNVSGFIPTGWYPTAVAVTPDGKSLLVGVGWGNVTKANRPPENVLEKVRAAAPQTGGYKSIPFGHVGGTLTGGLSIVEIPAEERLKKLTDQVYRNCPYSDKLLTEVPSKRKTAIPTKVGDPSPIQHVLYILKENRTYDQVLSDLPRGNRDPDLLMFGEEVTPNQHKLANEFVLLDNLYCNGHVSADGHPWSTMAYQTDYIGRNWALTYSSRKGIDDDDAGDLSNAPSGYLWDACKRQGLSYRSYGEYGGRVSQADGSFRMEGRVPGLVGHLCPTFGQIQKGRKARDPELVDIFLEEYRAFEKQGTLPRFMIMSLGENHTEGTRVGGPTPQACVASNDLALGKLVEALSQTESWKKLAIFVIEDDAQNGADHVDAHRTIGFVISPYVRRKHLDSTQYATVSMMRTMELILGIPPLSQYDAAATPMFESFTDTADLTPYEHMPARIDLDAINAKLAYGADRSEKMDFSEYDLVDDFELNEILWRAVKGFNSPVPPAVRRAIAYRGIELPEPQKP